MIVKSCIQYLSCVFAFHFQGTGKLMSKMPPVFSMCSVLIIIDIEALSLRQCQERERTSFSFEGLG